MANKTITEKLNEAITKFFRSNPRSVIGAGNAWRGFWLQALYIGERVADCEGNCIFLPETIEDLMVVFDAGTERERIELVQVKSLKTNALCLGDLKPKSKDTDLSKDDSFFGHLYTLWQQKFDISARIVVFGDIGHEMGNAYTELSTEGSLRHKMVERHGYPESFCEWTREHLTIEKADELALEQLLVQSLDQHVETAAAASLARDYVMSLICTCCCRRTEITEESWWKILADFGLQASSVRGYLENYGHTIVPLSEYLFNCDRDTSRLEASYRAGASATPEHIVLGLDIKRPEWQLEIKQAFESSNIVVVRAPSGQGKSTLCYRWLMDCETVSRVYLLNGISKDNAPGIAAALRGLANRTGNTIAYIEAGPDAGWVELCNEINRLNKTNLKLLISVREDDAAKSGYDSSKIESKDIILRFNKQEALNLYNHFESPFFPSFESAWRAFGENGPLMEFVYSLNNSTTLRQKLKGQVEQLRTTECDACLTFLYLASVAGEYGLSSSIVRLKDTSGLYDVQRILRVLENEMLLRSDAAHELVFPLHPYRAKLLAEIIAPMLYQDEEELVLKAAKCACGDFGPILIPYLSKHSLSQKGLGVLVQVAGRSWNSSAQALRVMIWKDARRFYLSTERLRSQMIDKGLPIGFSCMLAGSITENNDKKSWENLLAIFPDETMRESMSPLISELSSRKADYKETDRFLSVLTRNLPPADSVLGQASDAGFVLAYIGERNLKHLIPSDEVSRLSSIRNFGVSSVDGILDLLVGYNSVGIDINDEEFKTVFIKVCHRDGIVWLNSSELISQQAMAKSGENHEELPSECLDSKGMVRQLSAIVAPASESSIEEISSSDLGIDYSPNEVVMRAVCDLRRLFPGRGRYCVDYLGIKALVGDLEIPDCKKRIPEKNLRLNWMKLINQYYLGMCFLEDSLAADWEELEYSLRNAASDAISALRTCSYLIEALLRGDGKAIRRLQKKFGSKAEKAKNELGNIRVDFPFCARDPFAFTSGLTRAFTVDGEVSDLEAGLSLPAFGMKKSGNSIFGNIRAFFFSLQNHFNSLVDLILYVVGKRERPRAIAISNVAKACAEVKACCSDFSRIFDGDPILNEQQENELFKHAVYCNYLWCKGSAADISTLYEQKRRMKTLREMPSCLVERFEAEADVASAFLFGDNLFKVDYEASSDTPFSLVAINCIKDVINCDLDAEESCVEHQILSSGMLESIEVTFVSNGNSLIKRSYRLNTLINHQNDPSEVEKMTFGEIVFDESDITCREEAGVSFYAALGTGERLIKCIAEVREIVSARDMEDFNMVRDNWKKWLESVVGVLGNLIKHLDSVIGMYADAFSDDKILVSRFRVAVEKERQLIEELK